MPNHPSTNGQVERMERAIKDATAKRLPYEAHDQLFAHLADFMAADNCARSLKSLSGLTPFDYICKVGLRSQTISSSIRSTRCRGSLTRSFRQTENSE